MPQLKFASVRLCNRLQNVFTLRTVSEANSIAAASVGQRVVCIGGSFIGKTGVLKVERNWRSERNDFDKKVDVGNRADLLLLRSHLLIGLVVRRYSGIPFGIGTLTRSSLPAAVHTSIKSHPNFSNKNGPF